MSFKGYRVGRNIENHSFDMDIRLLIVKENGNVDAIFSSNDCSCKNLVSLSSEEPLDKLHILYEKLKDETYDNDDYKDRHLFYIKQYLNNHFVEEFEKRNINVGNINDDILFYYYLASMNNMIFISSSEHNNMAILPSFGNSPIQNDRLHEVRELFGPGRLWELTDDMYLDTFEHQGVTYATIDVGKSFSGDIHSVIDMYQEQKASSRKK